ncbi:hypothetical protein ACFWIA_08080 [Streptomyces sp. NPDC127068]|uniref:hypothetical protein n=1 Tax=Streptomyces sp. NPDC127068 TaxID=3347127 RepID=UPI00364FF4BE
MNDPLDQEGKTMWRRRRSRGEGGVRPDGVQAASTLALYLQSGGELAPVQVADLHLTEGEIAFADVMCSAARFYGTEVVYPYPRSTGYVEDHPSFGQRWVPNRRLNARRHREAEAAAEPRWRDHTPARLMLTSAGIRLRPPGSPTWLPFDHSLLSGVTLGRSEVVLSYTVCAPLLLTGPAAPWLGVAIEHLRRTTL